MIREKQKSEMRVLDLNGPDGNAFALLSLARMWAKQLEFDADAIVEEMTQGDYENLIEVFDKYFGSFVILER